jgi:transposase
MDEQEILSCGREELRRRSKRVLVELVLFLIETIGTQSRRIEQLEQKIREENAELNSWKAARMNKETHQPSSKKAEWEKETAKEKKGRRRKRNKRAGSGNKRKKEVQADEVNHNPLNECPRCGKNLSQGEALERPSRIVEDIAGAAEKTVITEEIQERKWCSECQKVVSSVTEKALARSDVGLNAVILIAYLWVVTALSLPNIQRLLCQFKSLQLSTAGLSKLMIRLADILQPLYEEILGEVKAGATIWADETGWRIKGQLWWLWIFANQRSAYYWPDRSRGSPVVEKILGTFFYGLLITDAWHAYTKIVCARQTCMAHILRKIRNFIKEFPQYRSIMSFFVKLKRIIREGEKLQAARAEIGEEAFQRRLQALKKRLHLLLAWKNPNPVLQDVIAKVRRQQPYILTFVEHPGAPAHNNYGEYIIKKGVLKRKISGGSMSEKGARAYACLQSIAQTCHLRNLSFHPFLKTTLIHYIRTGNPLSFADYEAQLDNQWKLAA